MTEVKKIMLKNVRLSYPNLFKHEVYQGASTGKYSATLLLHKEKNKEDIKRLQAAIQEEIVNSGVVTRLAPDKIALRDGDLREGVEFHGHMYIKPSTKRRPTVIDRDKTPIAEEDGILYSGCYVNVIVSLWFQKKEGFPKRVNSNLLGIQFSHDGDALGAAAIDVTNDFSVVDDGLDSAFS